MKYSKNDFFLIRILSIIAIISFLVLSLTCFLVGIPNLVRPFYFIKGYVHFIIFIQSMFGFIIFLSLLGIVLYNIKMIVIGCIKGDEKVIYIVSLIITVIYLILFYPFHNYTVIPMKMWHVINFFGCIYMFSFILLIDRKKKPEKSIDNRVFSLDYTDNKMYKHAKNKNIIFSKNEIIVLYILSFIIIAGFVFLSFRLFYITKIFNDLYSISFGFKHHYKFIITNPEYFCGWIIFIGFIGLLYFSLKGLWKGSISYNLKKTIYIFPLFILVILVYLLLYVPIVDTLPCTLLFWHFAHLIGIFFLIFMLYCYNNVFKKNIFSDNTFSTRKNVLSFSKREQKYIFICTILGSVFSLFYMIVNILMMNNDIEDLFTVSESFNVVNSTWIVCIFVIIALIYLNIKALGQVTNDKTRVNIRINLYITIFYLIVYLPFNIFINIPIVWVIIDGAGSIFFFFSFYFLLMGKYRIVFGDTRTINKEVSIIINTHDTLSTSNIIQEFMNEHKMVLDTISLIRKEDSIVKKHEELFAMKKILIKHLEKEKKYLYLPLQNAYEQNKELRETVEALVPNMEETTEYILSFYEKHEILTGAKGFLQELDKFFKELLIRISTEENIFFKKYKEYLKNGSGRKVPLENKLKYTKFEKINIYLVALTGIIFFIILTREIFYIDPTSYATRHNFYSPDNYFSIVIFVSLVILLYFLAKGFYISCKYNLPKRLFNFIIINTALIVYLFLYWPGLVEPPMSRLGWNIIHMIGIILILFIVLFIGKKNESTNIIPDKHHIQMNPKSRFSEKDIKYLFLLTLLCVIFSFSFVVVDIFGALNLFDYSYIYTYYSISNPFVDALIIYFCAILILFFYTIKGVFIGIKKKLNNKFIIKLFIIIIMLIVYFP
ncbi:MAG TPA: hemerythrin domain-containing protein, partial [Victivallales bacterium]|nr:hemerythrin domain-containing protein [Victivallales bacterium]